MPYEDLHQDWWHLNPSRQPSSTLLDAGQVWVWMASDPPHWEVRDTDFSTVDNAR